MFTQYCLYCCPPCPLPKIGKSYTGPYWCLCVICLPCLSANPAFSNWEHIGKTWSLPQSYCTRRRSGKNSCCRTEAVCRSWERARYSERSIVDFSRRSSILDLSGVEHQILGGGALACRYRRQRNTGKGLNRIIQCQQWFWKVFMVFLFSQGGRGND